MRFFVLFLLLKTYIAHFEYRAPNADSVFLAGTFNNWNAHDIKMKKKTGGIFFVDIPLEQGTYQYKFVVNGTNWVADPNSEGYAPDGFGGQNSVIRVPSNSTKEAVIRPHDGIINKNLLEDFNPDDARFINIDHDTLELYFGINTEDIDSAVIFINDERYTIYTGESPELKVFLKDSIVRLNVVLYDSSQTFTYLNTGYNVSILPHFETPSYLDTTVFYQIFPERFYNGDKSNDPEGTRAWKYEHIYAPWGWSAFYGGDINGILKKLSYLKELGVNALYLNPIFTSPSNHKYNTVDYFHVDPHFGGDSVFLSLLNTAHKNGIKVVLDGVFNHTSDQHPFFKDVRERGPESPYYNYYIVKKWPFPSVFDENNKPSDYYECWWGFGSLPKLNYNNNKVVSYTLGIAKYWENSGIDGFRLDVPNEVPHFFWRIFRDTMKHYNRDFYIVGEIWGNPYSWLSGDEFDGTMNYPLRGSIISLLTGTQDAEGFIKSVKGLYENMPRPARRAMLNILSTHDTRRIRTVLRGNTEKVKLAYLLSFTMPGVPCIYYGDEIGVEGEKDPDSRRVFPWDSVKANEKLLNYFKRLVKFRKTHPEFSEGGIKLISSNPICIERSTALNNYLVCINTDSTEHTLNYKGEIVFRTSLKQSRDTIYPCEGIIIHEK